jgi:hypothetical protein
LLVCFLCDLSDKQKSIVIDMKKKTQLLEIENDLLVDLTFHRVPATLLSEFAEKIVKPYYKGNMTAAFRDLIQKTLAEQDFIQAHIRCREA